jgi:hypothetical protein
VKTVRLKLFRRSSADGTAARDVTEYLLQPQNREKLMKTWQILLVIWMAGVGFWIANQFNRQNIERLKKRSHSA